MAYALVTAVPEALLAARKHGIDAVTLTLGILAGARRAAPWLLGGVKTTSYAVAMAAQREAADRGADDVIWLAGDGEVLEGATSNVAWVTRGRLVTPPHDNGILAGTTLAALQKDLEIEVRSGYVDELRAAEEIVLTSSIRGVVAVRMLDGAEVGTGGIGPVAAKLSASYEQLVRDEGG